MNATGRPRRSSKVSAWTLSPNEFWHTVTTGEWAETGAESPVGPP